MVGLILFIFIFLSTFGVVFSAIHGMDTTLQNNPGYKGEDLFEEDN